MQGKINYTNTTVKVYHGYGHKDNLVVYGHVLAGKRTRPRKYKTNPIFNSIHLIRQFLIKPIPGVRVQLQWGDQKIDSTTEADGFFKLEWESVADVAPGWHLVKVDLLNEEGGIASTGEGKLYVPQLTQYGFISDIDDTVLVSHSAKTGKKLKVMFTKNPRTRKTFSDVVKFYQQLSLAHTEPSLINPFFYVSSSEWNLYDDLNEFFKHNELPKGAFLLNQMKQWHQMLKTGKTKHQGKLTRILRLLEAFPKQHFVLLGDNTQKDPEIYATIANKYPDRIVAVYIRNISRKKESLTASLLASIENKKIYTCFFKHTSEAMVHAKTIELL